MKSLTIKNTTFPWVGGKWRIFPQLLPLIPHHKRYVSLFGGAAADLSRKPISSEEIYNDLDDDVVGFFRVLQVPRKRMLLSEMLFFTLYSRSEYSRCIDILHSNEPDAVTRAWAFFICATIGYCSKVPSLSTSGAFTVNPKLTSIYRWKAVTSHIEQIAKRFRYVLIENKSWEDVVDRHDAPETHFYADPPYVMSSRGGQKMYSHEMTDDAHENLVQRLTSIRGTAMLSGYENPLYDKLLVGWRKKHIKTYCSIAGHGRNTPRIEVVWMNYDEQGEKLNLMSQSEIVA